MPSCHKCDNNVKKRKKIQLGNEEYMLCDDCLTKYSDHKQNKTENKTLPLLFIASGQGTMGDKKPLVILGILTALYSPKDSPIVNIYLSVYDKKNFMFLHNFLPYLFGENNIKIDDNTIYVKNKLLITFKEKIMFSLDDNHLIFRCKNILDDNYGKNEILLDFGDNMGENRFVLPCLTYRKKTDVLSANMTSLFLPILPNTYWSYDRKNLKNIMEFCNKARQSEQKIILLLGSLEMVFHEYIITTWLKMQKEKQKYVFIIVGGYRNDETLISQEQYPNCLFFSEYIELEDVIKMVDFCITNCGAGSVAVPLVYGVPQTCSYSNISAGQDKDKNCEDLMKLNIGPLCRNMINFRNLVPINSVSTGNKLLDFFINMMTKIDNNFNIYKENAVKIKTEIQKHSFEKIMIQFLNDIQDKNSNTQQELIKTGRIPEKYVNKWTCTI